MSFSNCSPTTSSKRNQKKIQLDTPFLSFPLRFVICLIFLLQEGSSFDTLPDGNGENILQTRRNYLGGVVDDLLSGNDTKKQAALTKFGPIQNWDVSHITNFAYLFYNKQSFNSDLSSWVTSSATTMSYMFGGAKQFNSELTNFVTSKVNNMWRMFINAHEFNQPLSHFDTSKVTRMGGMFNWAKKFNQDISTFDLSSMTSMSGMFINALAFNKKWCNVQFDGLLVKGDFLSSKGMMLCKYLIYRFYTNDVTVAIFNTD